MKQRHELGKLSEHSSIALTDATGAQWEIKVTDQGISVSGYPYGYSRIAVHPSGAAAVEIVNAWKGES